MDGAKSKIKIKANGLVFTFLLILIFGQINSFAKSGEYSQPSCLVAIQKITPEDQSLKKAFIDCLQEYISIDTSNPPGNEERAIRFFQPIFQYLKIPTKIISSPNHRKSLVATLKGRKIEAIALYHHSDTVPVFPEQWLEPNLAFSGKNDGEYIWGRGALDMKSLGIFQLLTIAMLSQSKKTPNHTMIFLASADEEVASSGAHSLLPYLANAKILFNEGGYGISRKGKNIFLLGAEEKGGAWLQVLHEDPIRLITHIHNTFGVLTEATEYNRRSKYLWKSCKVNKFRTPGSQVNIIPSKVELSIQCAKVDKPVANEAMMEELQSLFQSNKIQNAKVFVTKDAEFEFTIRIQLESSGHGSLGALSAIDLSIQGFQSLGITELKPTHIPPYLRYYPTPATRDFIRSILELEGIPFADHIARIGIDLFEQPFLKKIASLAYSERLFRTSCSFTSLSFTAQSPEQKPEALLDCRTIHTGFSKKPIPRHAEAFISELQEYANDPTLSFTLIKGWNFTSDILSKSKREIFHSEIIKENPGAIFTTYLTPTSSDSTWFRAPHLLNSSIPRIESYGFFPVVLEEKLTETIHGSNERFPISQIIPGLKVYSQVIQKLDQLEL